MEHTRLIKILLVRKIQSLLLTKEVMNQRDMSQFSSAPLIRKMMGNDKNGSQNTARGGHFMILKMLCIGFRKLGWKLTSKSEGVRSPRKRIWAQIRGWNDMSEMTFRKRTPGMSLQVGFKRIGFFFWWKCDCRFNPPRFEFWSMRNFPCIVLGQTRVQIRSNSRVNMSPGSHIFQHIHVEKLSHSEEPSFHAFVRLHLLRRLRRDSLPLRVRLSAPPGLPRRKKIRQRPDLLKTGGVDETRTHDPHTASVVL